MEQTQTYTNMELLMQYDHKFDPIDIKRRYFNKLRKIYEAHGHAICVMNWNEMILQKSITSIKVNVADHKSAYKCMITVEVIQENGKDVLIWKRKTDTDPIIKFLSAEECFPVILKAHKDSNHGNADAIKELIGDSYEYPLFCIQLVLQSCNVCKELEKIINAKERKEIKTTKSVWKFMIHKMPIVRKFKYIFIYIEEVTKFVIIRPLMKFDVDELAMQFLTIFSTFGPPKTIITSINFNNLLSDALKFLRQFNENYKISVEICDDYMFEVGSVISELNKWREEMNSNDWEVGCRIVQWKYNTTLRVIKYTSVGHDVESGIPYNLFFGSNANAFNYVNGNIVSEQLSSKYRNKTTVKIIQNNTPHKVRTQVVDTGSDDEESLEAGRCIVCHEEFAMYVCETCFQPLHLKCGVVITRKFKTLKILCRPCTLEPIFRIDNLAASVALSAETQEAGSIPASGQSQ